jgi:hypothetical protein
MRAAGAAAERAAEVRGAARAWAAAGLITPATRAAIETRYPDDRTRLTPGLRILAFVFTVIAGAMLCAFVAVVIDVGTSGGVMVLAALGAAVAAGATEFQRGPLARADAGAEDATALLALGLAVLALVAALDALDLPLRLVLLLILGVAALAAARWGGATLGVLAAGAWLLLLADLRPGRLPWLAGTAAGAALLIPATRRAALAPGQRRACRWAAALLLVALYAGLNPLAVEQAWVERWSIDFRGGGFTPTVPLPVAWLGAALLPVVLALAGVRRRDLLLVALAGAMALATVATAHGYWPVLPLAYALLLAGLALAGAALGLRRWLRAAPAGERGGFTADALWSDTNRASVVQAVLRAAPLAPGAAPGTAAEPERGGRFAGGGASGEF